MNNLLTLIQILRKVLKLQKWREGHVLLPQEQFCKIKANLLVS
jgi:hypothetical protein